MRKSSVDLAVSSAAICVVVSAAEIRGLRHGDFFAVAKTRIALIQTVASSVDAPGLFGTIEEPVGPLATEQAQMGRASPPQSCSIDAPSLRLQGESQSQLALAP